MRKHRSSMSGSLVAAIALTVASWLTLAPAFAAEFTPGSYEAKGLVMTFAKGQQWHLNKGAEVVVSGTYVVKADQLEITDVAGPWACNKTAGMETGTYTWKVDNAVLTFTKVADACNERSNPMTSMQWKRQS
jgi:hypothetical protein